jgi:hypothetical protein
MRAAQQLEQVQRLRAALRLAALALVAGLLVVLVLLLLALLLLLLPATAAPLRTVVCWDHCLLQRLLRRRAALL